MNHWNDPRDFAKPVKEITLPQDILSTSDRRFIKLENQVQRLMEAHLSPTQPTQVNEITTSCEICSGPHDTQYCMEDPEQAFVEYAYSRTDEAGGKWYTFKPEQNNLGDTYNLSWKIHPNLSSWNLLGLLLMFLITYETPLMKIEEEVMVYPWIRYQIEEYSEGIRHSYEQRIKTIWSRLVNQVHVLDFDGLTPEMRQDLAVRLRMVYSKEGQHVFVSHAWRRLFRIRAPLVHDFILEFLSTCRMSDTKMGLDVADTLCFHLRDVRRRMTWRRFILALGLHTEQEMAEAGDFLGPAPSYVLIQDPVRRLCHKMIAYSISGRGRHLRRHAEVRKSGARLSGGHFIGRLAMHFGLRQQAATAGTHKADEASPAAEEGAQEIPAPAQAPPPPPPVSQPRTISQRIESIEEEVHDLRRDVVGLRGVVESFTTEQFRVSTWLISCMT
ncbi:hypothetical protein Tco_0755133 [Tanacetum coccineum]